MIEVGDMVRLARKRERPAGNRLGALVTVDIPRDQQRVGLVINDANNYACQMSVLVGGKVKYWFKKNVEKA
tara:strand:- start:152 stop:364 length:213 start_codon:yes stop_codon:yes gene_type:complete